MLDIALDNTERLRRLIEEILDIEGIESGGVAMRTEAKPRSSWKGHGEPSRRWPTTRA